jgi:hypothetical protein
MSDHEDIEEILTGFHHESDPRVREQVIATYGASHGPGRGWKRVSFWRRRIPLYAAVGALVIAAGFSFIAGQRLGGSTSRAENVQSGRDDGTAASDAIKWSVAESDVL